MMNILKVDQNIGVFDEMVFIIKQVAKNDFLNAKKNFEF